ncbi:hypothetical protein D187_009847 [Cystobacter fuscus DSM 2262]|uniref:Uncharacterized protein n=1 Tax=Cystobacter fuscus (strain ATCC 25194 / DSM 2262 / NBRC 100088 / M29) TaxID=1242864 RepID=S9QKX7_CYSF2|nr:hypothetical protein D187_009847 [Cystobacter fuscus DSM 2262]
MGAWGKAIRFSSRPSGKLGEPGRTLTRGVAKREGRKVSGPHGCHSAVEGFAMARRVNHCGADDGADGCPVVAAATRGQPLFRGTRTRGAEPSPTAGGGHRGAHAVPLRCSPGNPGG